MKNGLNQNIKKICFWVFSGFFWYLVISYFLLSDYPIYDQPFNHKIAYEVIKDALGLSAAFLAPAIAVVLFSDWRVQHTSIRNENISLQVKDLLNLTHLNMITLPPVGDKEQYSMSIKRHYEYMMALGRLEKELNPYNDISLDYVKTLKNINEFIYGCGLVMKGLTNPSQNQSDKFIVSSSNTENAQKLQNLSNDLKPLIVNPN